MATRFITYISNYIVFEYRILIAIVTFKKFPVGLSLILVKEVWEGGNSVGSNRYKLFVKLGVGYCFILLRVT